jgi:hypothetical protein
VLREAEGELEAAATREALNRAAAKLMDAKVKLQQLQAPVDRSIRRMDFRQASSRPPPAAR